MQKTLGWEGLERNSLENCHIEINTSGILMRSLIESHEGGSPFTFSYNMQLGPDWNFRAVAWNWKTLISAEEHLLERIKGNKWVLDEKASPLYDDCCFVDIALTPLTNSLPINMLGLNAGEERSIKVVYIDPGDNEIRPVEQKYTRISATIYHYENIPPDFIADIRVDENGFVEEYPPLFERIL